MKLSKVRIFNIVFTVFGIAIFSLIYLYVNYAPQSFNEHIRNFAISETKEKVGDNFDKIVRSSNKFNSDKAFKSNQLLIETDVLIYDILVAACKFDCTQKEKSDAAIDSTIESFNIKNNFAIDRLKSLVESEYDDIIIEVRTDLSIFSVSNVIIFIFAFMLSIFKRKAAAHLVPISFIMTGSTIVMIGWYIFGQNWMIAILTNNYWGWSYSFFIAIIFILLADITFNSARFMTIIFNSIGGVFSKLSLFISC